ncbi:MAG TPA: periplasmic heavy metal sensor, partial [Acidobacteriota bacterium]
ILLILAAGRFWAEEQSSDPIGEHLFPPELLMQNQQAIGLTDEQRTAIQKEIQTAQSTFTDWQWKLQNEMEHMVSLIKQDHVDEQKVLNQLDQILNIEREIKRTHFALVIRIKNKLTPDQIAKLVEIKKQSGK